MLNNSILEEYDTISQDNNNFIFDQVSQHDIEDPNQQQDFDTLSISRFFSFDSSDKNGNQKNLIQDDAESKYSMPSTFNSLFDHSIVSTASKSSGLHTHTISKEKNHKAPLIIDPKSQKKIQKMINNRVSAQISREKKKEYVEKLEKAAWNLKSHNIELISKVERMETELGIYRGHFHSCRCESKSQAGSSLMKLGFLMLCFVGCLVIMGGSNSISGGKSLFAPIVETKPLPAVDNFNPPIHQISESRTNITKALNHAKGSRAKVRGLTPLQVQKESIVAPSFNQIPKSSSKSQNQSKRRRKAQKKNVVLGNQLSTIMCPGSYIFESDQSNKAMNIQKKGKPRKVNRSDLIQFILSDDNMKNNDEIDQNYVEVVCKVEKIRKLQN